MRNQRRISRRHFLAGTLAATVAGHGACAVMAKEPLNNGLAPWNVNPETRSELVVGDPANIRLLQVTDLHFHHKRAMNPGKDQQTADDLRRYVDIHSPDAVLVTGDLWHDNPDHRGEEFMMYAIARLEEMGVPWLFTWGNHDQLDDYTVGHAAMTNARRSLYRGGPGGGCYTVALTDREGNLLWDLVCLNSMDNGLMEPQRAWLREEKLIRQQEQGAHNAFGVFHIPVSQYDSIWTNGAASGVKLEEVCSWGEDGTSLADLAALGIIRTCFVGHDHVNDYAGVFGDIELAYGRATGRAGYGGETVPKGAKLITIDAAAGRYSWVTVCADGTTWVPVQGKRIDAHVEGMWGGV